MKLRWVAALIVCYFVYLLIGAAIFSAIERPQEQKSCQDATDSINLLKLQISNRTNNITIEDLESVTAILQTAAANGISVDKNFEVSCTVNFDFQSAFFFSGTVITTIGYGNISPKTSGGRTFCIFYALFGIPLFAIMFSAIGDRLAKVVKRVDKKLELKIKRMWLRSVIVFTVFAASLVVFCLLIPAAIFMAVEDWTYRDSFYYSFITLTTIGFGDFVVGTNSDIEYIPIYRVLVYFWILFGCAYMASTISLASDFMKKSVRRTKSEPEPEEADGSYNEEEEAEKQTPSDQESNVPKFGGDGAATSPYYDDVPNEENNYVNVSDNDSEDVHEGDEAKSNGKTLPVYDNVSLENDTPGKHPVNDQEESEDDYEIAVNVRDAGITAIDGENDVE